MARVVVIGGGPAGATFATRMAQLGHTVTLVERTAVPCPRLGEALTPGVLPLLGPTGARELVATAGFPTAAPIVVRWDGPERLREDPGARGLLVDRGRFDALLLDAARATGVRVLRPARVIRRAEGWIDVAAVGGTERLAVDFVAEAGGRAGAARQPTAARTLAVHGYWQGGGLAEAPRIEAMADAWVWSVPLPGGRTNVIAFVDPRGFRALGGETLAARYAGILAGSSLPFDGARLVSPVRATDATPGLAGEPVGARRIAVGDAALALDPLSSSGVQHALRSALAAAVVANTILRRPEAAEAAKGFYRDSLAETSVRHAAWAAERYASAGRPARFWTDRAAGAGALVAEARPDPAPDRPVEVAEGVAVVEVPCIDGDFVAARPAVRYPGVDRPVAFVGGQDIVPFLRSIRAGSTPVEIARARAGEQSFGSALALAFWMVRAGILVERRA